MSRFPSSQYHGNNYGPRFTFSEGQFRSRTMGFPGPRGFSNYQGTGFLGPQHHGQGQGMHPPPARYNQRQHGPHYRGRRGSGRGMIVVRPPTNGRLPPPESYGYEDEGRHNNYYSALNQNKNADHELTEENSAGNFNKSQHKKFDGGTNNKRKFGENERQGSKKKIKNDKEFSSSHYCDVCDRGFQSKELLDEHTAQHVKCREKDCRFIAHAKVVKVHFKLHHGPGSKKIRWLDTPDEIQKWRNERKRNFPTAAKIVRKDVEVEQRKIQGNVLETKQFGKWNKAHRGQKSQPSQLRYQQCREEERREHALPTQPEKTGAESTTTDKDRSRTSRMNDEAGVLSPMNEFQTSHAMQSSEGGTHSLSSSELQRHDCDPLSLLAPIHDSGDEVVDEGDEVNVEIAPKGMFGALGSLAACYHSDSDHSMEHESYIDANGNEEGPAENTLQENEHHLTKDNSFLETTTKDKNENNCHDNRKREEKKKKKIEGQEWRKQKNGARGMRTTERKKATLLEMLLAPEIRKERNILLQCVRHIVQNDFFQASTSSHKGYQEVTQGQSLSS